VYLQMSTGPLQWGAQSDRCWRRTFGESLVLVRQRERTQLPLPPHVVIGAQQFGCRENGGRVAQFDAPFGSAREWFGFWCIRKANAPYESVSLVSGPHYMCPTGSKSLCQKKNENYPYLARGHLVLSPSAARSTCLYSWEKYPANKA
jgi:hypothetical protein